MGRGGGKTSKTLYSHHVIVQNKYLEAISCIVGQVMCTPNTGGGRHSWLPHPASILRRI